MPNKNWIKIEQYAFSKAEWHWITKLIYGFLAGFFVGIGYTAMLVIEKKLTGGVDDALTKFFGSLIFCTGIVMCMFVGANLFTGNCAVYAPVITKRISRKRFYLDLLLTFVGNYIGSIAIVLLIWAIGILDKEAQAKVTEVAIAKIQLDWYKTFLSGIITNVLVVGTVICINVFDNKLVGFFATLLMITAFAICGFQHVVANMYITTMGGLLGIFNGNSQLVGQLFYNCLLMSLLGNFAGGVLLTLCYYLSWNKLNKNKE